MNKWGKNASVENFEAECQLLGRENIGFDDERFQDLQESSGRDVTAS